MTTLPTFCRSAAPIHSSKGIIALAALIRDAFWASDSWGSACAHVTGASNACGNGDKTRLASGGAALVQGNSRNWKPNQL